jgi:hypothetical protein
MASDVTTYDAALKEVYASIPSDELNNATPLYDRIKRVKRPLTDGREFVYALHGRRNQQVGAQPLAGAVVPTAANQAQEGYDNAKYKPTQMVGAIKIEHSLMELSRTNEGSFVRALRSEVEAMAENFAVDFNRQLFGDGTGALSVCGVTAASTSVVLAANGTAPLEVGMGVDVIVTADGTTSTGAVGRYVSSITNTTTFVISGAAITTDATFSVYRAGSRTNEVNGLQIIVKASGALGGINPSTAGIEYWAAATVDSTTTVPTEVALQKVYEAPQEQKRGGGGKPNLLIGSFGARRSYQGQLVAIKRITQSVMRMVGGFEALDYNGLPFYADRLCTAKTIYMLDTARLAFLQTRDSHWVEDDGHILKWVSDTLAFKGVYDWIVQLATDARNAHSSLTNITES